jgi:HEAT repeat protein
VRKHRKLLTALAAFAAAASLTALLARDRQPTYQDRPLSAWLEIYGSHPDDPQPAISALRQIGTNAIPFLLQWISYEPSPLRTQFDKLLEKVPDRWRPHWLESPGNRSYDAALAFRMLGDAGSPAIPQLSKQAATTTDEQGIQCATIALGGIGVAALPALLATTTNSQKMARYFAVEAIATLGESALPALPTLIKSLEDLQVEVCCSAADALGRLALAPATCIPALTNLLTNPDPARRAYAARGLAGFAAAARQAAGPLQKALQDPDGWPRDEARKALDAIAPELLTDP